MSGGLNRSSSGPTKNILPPQELLDDLCSRFVLNVPKEDQQSFERILFLVEYAHWFYEDNSVEKNPSLKSLTLKEFTSLCIFQELYQSPCLLVKGWKGSSWSFPRGKKNKDEEDHKCATREVLEETGFDVSELLNEDEYIEMIFGQQRVRLYIVSGVKEGTSFAPQTKKEISEIAWQRLDELQSASGDVISRGVTGLKLYMVAPFLASLKSWISKHPSPVAARYDKARKVTDWKAKNNTSGNPTSTTENQPSKVVVDVQPVRAFQNFRFDTGPILQAVDAAFSN